MSPSVLRRYTPPTCTLEIAATGSALSRWTDRTVLKNLRFQLSLDDPKLPPEQQITITGDRLQLEALCEAVEAYVQSLLNQAPDQLHALLIQSHPDQGKLPIAPPKAPELALASAPSAGIYLKPKGLLAHDLCLGSLAGGEFGSTVHLSALQLFDLANALDEYHAEALTLPALGRPAWLKSPAGWARAAAVLVLAIGATGAVTKFVLDIASPVSQVASNSQEVEVAVQPPASDQAASPTPLPLPSSGVPSSELQLKPLFPPKPPAGAVRPVPVPSDQANLPPTGVTQAPATVSSADLPPQVASEKAPASPQVVVLPSPDGSSPTTQPPLAFADAPPNLASSSSAAIAPMTAEGSSLRSSSIPVEPTGRNQAIGGEAPQVATRSTVFDNYPQIAEVRDYFSQKWQPPTELNQTLEYRLVLAANGTIQRIIPLGDASERYVDRTNMPLMGESFVSPLQDRDHLQVRLVLSPDGKVQAFSDGNQ